jgi:hypothetical protein
VAQWTPKGFHVQHWQALIYGVDIDVYEGQPGRAYDAFLAGMPRLEKSLLLHAGFIRTMTAFVGGRLAVASIGSRPELKQERLADARRAVRKLTRERDPWAHALAHLVTAAADNASGDRAGAIEALRRAIGAMDATETKIFTAPARHRLGQLLGGDEGRGFIEQARDIAAAYGVRDLERWISIYAPGTWTGPQ